MVEIPYGESVEGWSDEQLACRLRAMSDDPSLRPEPQSHLREAAKRLMATDENEDGSDD